MLAGPRKCLANPEEPLAGNDATLAELRSTYVKIISKPKALPMVTPEAAFIWLEAPAAAL